MQSESALQGRSGEAYRLVAAKWSSELCFCDAANKRAVWRRSSCQVVRAFAAQRESVPSSGGQVVACSSDQATKWTSGLCFCDQVGKWIVLLQHSGQVDCASADKWDVLLRPSGQVGCASATQRRSVPSGGGQTAKWFVFQRRSEGMYRLSAAKWSSDLCFRVAAKKHTV